MAKRSLPRRILRWFGIFLGVVVVLVGLLFGFLQTKTGKNIVRARLEARLSARLDGTITIGSLDYSPLFREVELRDVVIRDRAGRPALALGSVTATLDRRSILAKTPVIDQLAVTGLDVTTANLRGIAKPSTSGGTPLASLSIKRLIVDGAVRVERPDGTRLDLRDIHVAGRVHARPAAEELDLALTDVRANATMVRPGHIPRELAVAVTTVTVAKRADAIAIEVGPVTAGAVSVATMTANLTFANQQLVGNQTIKLGGVRVENGQLAALVGRDVLRDDATADVTVSGPIDKLVVDGDIRTGPSHLALDGSVDLTDPVIPKYNLIATGTQLRSDAVLSQRSLPAVETSVRATVVGSGITRGAIDAKVTVAVTNTTIGGIAFEGLTLDATTARGALRLDSLHAVGPGLVVDGSGTFSAERVLDGALTVHATPSMMIETLAEFGLTVPPGTPLPPTVDLSIKAKGQVDGTVAVTIEPTEIAVARGRIAIKGRATLEQKKLATASVSVGLQRLDLATLARLSGRRPKVAGSLSGSLTLTKAGDARRATYDLAAVIPQQGVTVTARGTATPARLNAALSATRTRDRSVLATATATIPLARRGGRTAVNPAGSLAVKLDVPSRGLGELAELLPERLRAKLPAFASSGSAGARSGAGGVAESIGNAELHVDLHGTAGRPRGTVTLAAQAVVVKGETQRVALTSDVSSTAAGLVITPKGSVWLRDEAMPIATLDGSITTLAPFARGRLDLRSLRSSAKLDLALTLPPRELAALAWLGLPLAKLGGTLDGRIAITGTATAPRFAAALTVHDMPTADSATHDVVVTADGTPTRLTATIAHGTALTIVATVDRTTPGRVAIDAHATAAKAPLRTIIPAFLAPRLGPHTPGELDWDMTAKLALVQGPHGLVAEPIAITGRLAVTGGEVRVPDSKRSWRDISLVIASEPTGLRLRALELHETDREVADRVIRASGFLTLDRFKPQHATLALTTHKWLLSGVKALGKHDAPRATLDADLAVTVDLRAPILAVDATINALALNMPERFDRAHQYENVALGGDVIYTDGGVGVGKLPYVAPPSTTSKPRRPIDVTVHIPKPIRIQQPPLELEATGEVTIKVRDEGVAARGALELTRGHAEVMGNAYHMVPGGSLVLSDEHPKGYLDVTFESVLDPAVKRELSRPSIGGAGGARISLRGSPAHPARLLGGANNASLIDAMSINTVGHPGTSSAPDRPAAETVNLARQDPLQILSFMAQNLPHLLVLDRMTAYSDPSGARGAYGRIQNVEAERYARDQRSRMRAVARPPTPGRSDVELHYDRLFFNNGHTAAGVGLRAGDRAGGGVGAFVEWSSD